MNGTPYWGTECFSELRSLSEIETTPLSISEINDLCRSKGITVHVTDMYSLFLSLAHLDFLFVVEDNGTWVSWCRDIRFNYRDRFLFIPYYSYKTTEYEMSSRFKDMRQLDLIRDGVANVRHSFELSSLVLDDRRTGFRANSVILYDYENKKKYFVSLKGIHSLSEPCFSIVDLFDRYIDSAYIASDLHDFYWEKYTRIDNKFKNNREHLLRKKLGVKAYSENYHELTYNDVRQYTYEDLKNTSLISDNEVSYWLRLLNFEAYLYCVFASGATVIEDQYKELFEKLGDSLRFISYCKNGKCLVLKHYYKDNIKMRVKSYERYRRN